MKHTRNRGKEPRKLSGSFKNRLEILVSQNNSKWLEMKPFHSQEGGKRNFFFQVTRTEKKLVLISHQIPRTEFKRFVWWSMRRIKGLITLVELLHLMHESHRYKFILYSHTEVIISHAFYASYFSMQTVPIKLFILLIIIWLFLVPFVPEHFPTVQIFMHSYPYICP